jgi:carboxyl-terminal processing protease
MQALEGLKKQGLKRLIYDLRGNGGGFMNEAFDMADEFLKDERLVVYTEGANSPKEEYFCKRPGLFEDGKLVILLDELSASASEVLAGALQDWDRATIVGRRSFGKGLVQLQYPLGDGSAIRLTTARYYTPLGRSIQRPYDKGKKVYMDELWERYNNGEVLYEDSNKVSNGKIYVTPGGDTLYGAGGIMPDVFVPIDTSSYPAAINRLFLQGAVNNFVYRYYLQHRGRIDQIESLSQFDKAFSGDNGMWNEFTTYLRNDSIPVVTVSESTRLSLQRRMAGYLARFRWRNTGYFKLYNQEDPMVLEALRIVRER